MNNAKWVLDPTHSEIGFKVKHLMISNVKGSFKEFNGSLSSDNLSDALVEIEINANSIFTNNDDRDNHLKSGDFFEVDKYALITFKGTSIKMLNEENAEITGDLTIKEVTNPITLKLEIGGTNKDPWGNEKLALEVNGVINRKDWGLNWNSALETGGVLVGEEIKINAEVQFVKQA